jgi:hypothetical protein
MNKNPICKYCGKKAVETEDNLWGLHKTLLGKHLYCPWWGKLLYEPYEPE